MKKLEITFLGTNGWYDTKTGNTICILIDCPDYYIVLDAGNGLGKLDRHIDQKKPVYIFLSHFHLDHIIGLHTLPKYRFKKRLTIIGQKGTRDTLKVFLNWPFTLPRENLKFKSEIIEVPGELKKLPFRVKVLPMLHASPTLGIRLEIDGKIIAYCPDTGYCKNAVILSENADLVITECAYTVDFKVKNWPHLNPETAAKIASESKAKKLILTHFDAEKYPDLRSRGKAELIAKKIFPNSIASSDDMKIEI
jgi:ribonuclease BN (tRNA processing enzyme)